MPSSVFSRPVVFAVFLIGVAAQAEAQSNSRLVIRDGVLIRGRTSEFTMRAVEVPDFAKPGQSLDDVIRTCNRLGYHGANSVALHIGGLSADGKSIDPEVPKALAAVMSAVSWHGIAPICRVFPPGAPESQKYREAAVRAVASAFKQDEWMAFWLEGENVKKLASIFRKVHPTAVIIASEGADMDAVTQWPAVKRERPSVMIGSLPPDVAMDYRHCILPAGDESLVSLEKGVALPVESQPWTPDNSVLSEGERADGFIALFDGKTLNGWGVTGNNKEGFAAEDGAIVWKARGGGTLRTRDRYDDFVLRLDWKINPRGNSGVHLRAPRAGRSSKIGMEFQMMGDHGVEPTKNTTGALYDVVPPRINAGKPAGEWNQTEITLNGPHVKYVLNGEVVIDLNMDEHDELRNRNRDGFIALTDHGSPVSFKNIRLKKL